MTHNDLLSLIVAVTSELSIHVYWFLDGVEIIAFSIYLVTISSIKWIFFIDDVFIIWHISFLTVLVWLGKIIIVLLWL